MILCNLEAIRVADVARRRRFFLNFLSLFCILFLVPKYPAVARKKLVVLEGTEEKKKKLVQLFASAVNKIAF